MEVVEQSWWVWLAFVALTVVAEPAQEEEKWRVKEGLSQWELRTWFRRRTIVEKRRL